MREDRGLRRRGVLKLLSGLGAGAVFGRALVTLAADKAVVSGEMVRQAAWVSGLSFSDKETELMLEDVNGLIESYDTLRKVPLPNGVPPVLHFRPAGDAPATTAGPGVVRATERAAARRPDDPAR